MSSRIVPINRLLGEEYGSVLCYPRFSPNEAEKRVSQLKCSGVKAVEFSGGKTAFNLHVLGKGKVGIVLTAYVKTRRVAVKIRRVDASRKEMTHEAALLGKANRVGVGPQLIGGDKDFILLEFVEGMTLPEWVISLKGRGARKRIRGVLSDVLQQCRRLDDAGLDHGELSRAHKHIIVDSLDKAHIIDFEAASTRRRPSNVTSICQYLYIGSQLAQILRRKLGKIDSKALVAVLRRYKSNRTEQNFAKILEACSLKSKRHQVWLSIQTPKMIQVASSRTLKSSRKS